MEENRNSKLSIQTLISTMHQKDYSLLDRMNIQTDAIVVNQCDKNEITSFEYNGYKILWISLCERGIGLSRNTALMRATADILLFADDDVVYESGIADKVKREFELNSAYGMILFNFCSLNEKRPEYIDKKNHRIHWYNSLKYGACRIAVRREIIAKKNIYFSLLFGGGAKYQAGEDNLFINQALQSGIKVLASNQVLGSVAQEESTWFHGYDEKYYYDRGFLLANIYGKNAKIIFLLLCIKDMRNKTKYSIKKILRMEMQGFKDYYDTTNK